MREPGVVAEKNREDPGGHRIKRAKMADGLFPGNAPQPADDVVTGDAAGFIYDEKAVHWNTLAVPRQMAAAAGAGLHNKMPSTWKRS